VSWNNVGSIQELNEKKRLIFKQGAKQILVCVVQGTYFALDNRCPHQGFPLKEGDVNESTCVLTCNWHNWKFDLKTGNCISGGDSVQTYPVKSESGCVWVKIVKPTQEEIKSQILKSLKIAVTESKFGRLIREVAKLHFNKLDPLEALTQSIIWTSDYCKDGMVHAHAVAADWVKLFQKQNTSIEDQLICLSQAINYISESSSQQPKKSFTTSSQPFSHRSLLDAIESEDEDKAQALLNDAFSKEMSWESLRETFSQAALVHYNSFGHSLIFVTKVDSLIKDLGASVTKPLTQLLTRHLCQTTREDLLPEFKFYNKALSEFPTAFGTDSKKWDDPTLFQLSTQKVIQKLSEQTPQSKPEVLFDTLLGAAAQNMLMFDATYQDAVDNSITDNVGWLDITHAITFANAVSETCKIYPQLWPQGLLQLACFVGRNRHYVDADQTITPWEVKDVDLFQIKVVQKLLDPGVNSPILVAHYVKTYLAVMNLRLISSEGTFRCLLSALNRFLNSPYKQVHIRRKVRQNLALIAKDFK
jgi:nitrite reductase/ring-hydroxylating ferredoxin subunit